MGSDGYYWIVELVANSYIAISIDAAVTRADPPDQAGQWGATLPSLSREFPP